MKEEIEQIKIRNQRVELDKAWEISKTRRVLIMVMTYLVVVLFLWLIEAAHPWLHALVPTGGFLLSTLSLPFFKRMWIRRVYKR